MNLVRIGMQGERSLDFTGKAFRLVGISARQLKPQNEERVSCSCLRRHQSYRVEGSALIESFSLSFANLSGFRF